MMPTKYKIGEVSISKDGTFWIGYYGKHAEQGGVSFQWGEIGTNSLEAAMALLQQGLQEGMEPIQEILEAKHDK
jgi:hypothetical protein